MNKTTIKSLMYLIIAVLLLTACDFSYNKKLGNSNYYIGWVNGKEYATLFFGDKNGQEEIMNARVTDVYWNDKYILAKQCKLHSNEIVGYYIFKIVKYGKEKATKNRIGPLSQKEYDRMKVKLLLNESTMNHINIFD